MNDDTPTQPPDQPAEPTTEEQPSRLDRLRARGRTLGKGTVVALVAGLVVGSAGGLAVGAVSTGSDDDSRGGVHDRPFGDEDSQQDGQPDGRPEGAVPGGAPGQLPPATTPEDADGAEQPSGDLNS